ncbi:acyltransferase [Pseudomonas sp. Irchel s3b2]|uniref:acyltransferase family protein n=1 Tax=Pseudomonas sp. Irchel s3b2 TaxID=2009073 RepID=UPI000BA32D79|nr:acyltransferase [Pseudomonas sp. Irchel s3b2]
MKLSAILKRENNNLDVFRILAAIMVIYGHAYALLPNNGQSDFIGRMLEYDYSGSLAVKIFFFLSGLVVTNSLISKGNAYEFVISRLFRIWPALITTIIICTVIIGPILSTKTIEEYFSDPSTASYITGNISLHTNYALPGVFEFNKYPNTVNGSLWTIPYEVYAYVTLLSLFMIGISRSHALAIFTFVIIAAAPILKFDFIYNVFPTNHETLMLGPCFAYGSIMAILKENININISTAIGSWTLFFILKGSKIEMYALYSAIFITIIYLSSTAALLKIKPNHDISYGVYLWGFPVQQILSIYISEYGILANQIIAIIISCILGYISWILIEKKCIKIGSLLFKKTSNINFKLINRQTTDIGA